MIGLSSVKPVVDVMIHHGNNELAVKNFTTIATAKGKRRIENDTDEAIPKTVHDVRKFVRWRQDGTGYDIATAKPGETLRPRRCQPKPVNRGGRDT